MQQPNNSMQHAQYHTGYAEHYQQQQQQQQQYQQHQAYYPAAAPYTATIAQPNYHAHMQQPMQTAAFDPNAYHADQSSFLPHAVPALILPSADPALDVAEYAPPLPPAPASPPPPAIKFGDVFHGATLDMVLRQSLPVRELNHAQMRVWQQFESGDTVRSISDSMGLKPNVVLNYIIYALESYSPAPSHPVFLHWPRFSIPPELMERVSAAMVRVGGALGRLDIVKDRLDGGKALDEDIRIAMIRWKMERALGATFEQFNMYRVMSAQDAAERLARQQKEDAGDDSAAEDGEQKASSKAGEGALVEEEKKEGSSAMAVDTAAVRDVVDSAVAESKQQPAVPAQPLQAQRTQAEEKEQPKKQQEEELLGTGELPYPPPLNASEMLFQLFLNGGTSQRCLIGRFQRDWREIEVVLDKLIADQLAWKRGLLWCPS